MKIYIHTALNLLGFEDTRSLYAIIQGVGRSLSGMLQQNLFNAALRYNYIRTYIATSLMFHRTQT